MKWRSWTLTELFIDSLTSAEPDVTWSGRANVQCLLCQTGRRTTYFWQTLSVQKGSMLTGRIFDQVRTQRVTVRDGAVHLRNNTRHKRKQNTTLGVFPVFTSLALTLETLMSGMRRPWLSPCSRPIVAPVHVMMLRLPTSKHDDSSTIMRMQGGYRPLDAARKNIIQQS